MIQLTDFYRAKEKNAVRRMKERYNLEYKRVCGTLGWRDFAIGNLSAQENGDLGPIEIRIKQIIQEEDEHKLGKDAEKARSARLASIETTVLSNHADGGSARKKAKTVDTNSVVGSTVSENDAVSYMRMNLMLSLLLLLSLL